MTALPLRPRARVIDDARRRQLRHRAGAVALAAAIVAIAWGGGPGGVLPSNNSAGGPPPSGPVASAGGSRPGRVLSSLGLSVVLPAGWFGRSRVLPTGGPGSAWVQAADFALDPSAPGVDPIEAMGSDGVVLTIDEDGPQRTVVAGVQPLTLAKDRMPEARTPRGWVLLEESALLRGGSVAISAGFGSSRAVSRLLPVVNRLLGTLRARGG